MEGCDAIPEAVDGLDSRPTCKHDLSTEEGSLARIAELREALDAAKQEFNDKAKSIALWSALGSLEEPSGAQQQRRGVLHR